MITITKTVLDVQEIIRKYYTEEEIKEHLKTFFAKLSEPEPQEQNLEKNPLFIPELRDKIDKIITFSETRLKKDKYLLLLLELGKYCISKGALAFSSDIFGRIISLAANTKNTAKIKASAYLALSDVLSRQAFWKESISSINNAKKIFSNLNDKEGLAQCENFLGSKHGELGNLDKAEKHFKKAITHLDSKKDKFLIASIEVNLGNIHSLRRNFDLAFSYFSRALPRYEELGDKRRIAEIKHNLGLMFYLKKDYSSAISEYDESLNIACKEGFLPLRGILYLSKAQVCSELDDLQMASAYADQCLEICGQINDKLSIAEAYKIKGILHKKRKRFALAENYLLSSLRINQDLGNELNIAETNVELGALYKLLNQRTEAEFYFEKAISYYDKIGAQKEIQEIQKNLIY